MALGMMVGCAADKMGDDGVTPGDDDGGGGDPTPPTPPQPLDPTGSFRIHSKFDIAQNMPGTVGTVVNGLIAATDEPDDPMKWVLEQAIASMPDGFLKDALTAAVPFLAPQLNDQVTQLAPNLVSTLLRVGQDISDISKKFGLSEQLDVTQNDQQYTGVVTADGFELTVEGTQHDYAFSAYQIDNIVATGVAVHTDATNTFYIGRHELPVPYGTAVRIALDEAIIPLIDPNAHNLGELLNGMIDCTSIGQQMADAIGLGSASMWAGVCVAGVNLAADQIYGQIANIDSSLMDFKIDGKAVCSDTNHDTKVDKLDQGTWAGQLDYAGTGAALGPATFFGQRQ